MAIAGDTATSHPIEKQPYLGVKQLRENEDLKTVHPDLSEGFECEVGPAFLTCSVTSGDLLYLTIGDPDENQSMTVSIGPSQAVNLLEYLLKAQSRLKGRSPNENAWISTKLNELKENFS